MNSISIFIAVILVALVYFIPAMLAYARGHVNALPVALTNLFFGWTIAGWAVALIWALTHQGTPGASSGSASVSAPVKKAPRFAKALTAAAFGLVVLFVLMFFFVKHPGHEGGMPEKARGTVSSAPDAPSGVKPGVPVPAEELFK